MDNKPIIFPNQIIQPIINNSAKQRSPLGQENPKVGFKAILEKEILGGLKFSKHAQERLLKRDIKLSEDDINKISEAVGKAQTKGAKESLVLMGDLALVVSIKNRTVITAVDGSSLRDNIFTNIDSAIII